MRRHWNKLGDTSELMNNVILSFQSLAELVVLMWLVAARRRRLSSDVVYLALMVAAVIALSPNFPTRYLLAVYGL